MFDNVSVIFTLLVIFCFFNCKSLTRQIVFESRMFGGNPVAHKAEFEFKWLVALHNRVRDQFFCAGSLISPLHVLTAAHCFQPKGQLEKLSPQEFLCRIGRFNLSDRNEDDTIDSLVWDVVSNPMWNFSDERYYSDIAIVVLQDEIVFTSVHLPTRSSEDFTSTGTIAGWGKSNNKSGRHDDTPRTLQIPVVNITHCMMKSPSLGRQLSYSVFCGGYYKKAKGPCTGDSGGGLFIKPLNESWEVRGIISMSLNDGTNGCDPDNFAFYTNVSYFSDWIAKTMEETKAKVWKFLNFECKRTNITEEEVVNCDSSDISPNGRNLIMQVKNESVRAAKKLQIDFGKSPQIVQGIGKAFTNLRSLTVYNHNLKSVERSDFASMSNLERLVLYRNKIRVIADDAFDDLLRLELLTLNDCGIRKISRNWFSKLTRLTLLSLEENSLRSIPENAFENLPNLYSLSLTRNPIRKLPKNLLLKNTRIEQFFCNNCELHEIGFDFSEFPKMKEVFLEDNRCVDEIYSSYYHPDFKSIDTIGDLQEKIFSRCQTK